MVSINTNAGLNSALRNYNSINVALDKTGDRISTGFKVIGPKDDASTFAVAQGVRADLKAFQAVDNSLAQAQGLMDTVIAGLRSLSDQAAAIKTKIIEAANPANTATQQAVLKADLQAMADLALTIFNETQYNGRNQLLTGSIPVDFVATVDGDTITVPVFGLGDTFNPLNAAIDAANTSDDFLALIPTFTTYETDIGENLGAAGAVYKQIQGQRQQNRTLADALTEGLGSMVDADLSKESATYTAEQTQQQLASRSLQVATSFIQVIRGLFA